ncbi:MAG: serine hydrolase [candidate division KSB1 bacterium]|nr:serine hydrolase [candidate division KSB1 bacterium]MDZ7276445.1 serine hydrolase [candidate division KSB1 bacterium]MDZ7288114.1 serine hydrolase [candidate division KSB1 bacterium]MDZ7300215.1 serine hydrolase [candidate division KSB1 bacterium]MDZ7305786.1 serine hydrolase [candidate division KSB1 bacterium]
MSFLNHRYCETMTAGAAAWPRTGQQGVVAFSPALRRVLCGVALLWAGHLMAQAVPAKPARGLQQDSPSWVEQTLRRMSLREKLGQLFFYYLDADFKPESDPKLQNIERLVTQHHLGGLHLWRGEPYATAHLTNRLQALSKLPLLFTADLENGTARFGGTEFPPNMAIAATGDVKLAYEMGRHTAGEARALGIGLTFAPVVDINSNPGNPIINVRAFGEEAETVSRFAEAFLRGCRQGGLLATAKHFPGHGDTRQDSHLELALVAADSARLEQLELVPFRRAIAAGVDFIMTAHVNVRGFAMNPYAPATLSPEILTQLLRERLHFEGVIITDAMHMWAITRNYTAAFATVAALNAGVDVILAQEDVPAMIADLERRVRSGEIAEARIEQSVRRILLAKTRIGLHQQRRVEPAAVARWLQRPEAVQAAEQAAARSITLLKNEGGLLPLAPGQRMVVVNLWDEPRSFNHTPFLRELQRFVQPAAVLSLHPGSSVPEVARALAAVRQAQVQVLPVYATIGSWKGHIGLPRVMQPMIDSLLATGVPAAVISMGNPYVYPQVQQAAAYLVAYDDETRMSQAAARAVAGAAAIAGRLPITIPGFFARGAGLTLAARDHVPLVAPAAIAPTLQMAFPEEAGMTKTGLDSVRALMQQAVRDSVFPGAVLLVARHGKIALHEAFGTLGYGAFNRPTPLHAIYDLASLTKVVAMTTACMLLYERGRLQLDEKVQTYLPEFTGQDKDKITVRHLLTHSAGLVAFRLYYRDYRTPEEILNTILREPLEYPTASKTVYSDLSAILLGKIVERLSGKTLDAFCRDEIFRPLGMHDTGYLPPAEWLPRLAPTEFDTWTEGRKGSWVHGVVHDENAYRLGGVSGHAGLFSSARDLAVFLQMLLNGGSYGETKLLEAQTIAQFTARQEVVPGSSRALGWDTADGQNSAGTLMRHKAYGHTGFTGTSLWTDPERGLIVVLLSNRVHPTRENRRILSFRPQLHDAVVRAILP